MCINPAIKILADEYAKSNERLIDICCGETNYTNAEDDIAAAHLLKDHMEKLLATIDSLSAKCICSCCKKSLEKN